MLTRAGVAARRCAAAVTRVPRRSAASARPPPSAVPSAAAPPAVRRPRSPERRKAEPDFPRFHAVPLPESAPSSAAPPAKQAAPRPDAPPAATAARGSKKLKGVRSVKAEPGPQPPSAIAGATDRERALAKAFCTADKYDLGVLKPLLQRHFVLNPYLAEDVYHVKLVTRQEEDWHKHAPAGADAAADEAFISPAEAFIFDNGSFVTWGATAAQQQQIREIVKEAEVDAYDFLENEEFDYVRDEKPSSLAGDVILLGNDMPLAQSELAFSAGLSRSVKLASLEELLDRFLDSNRHIPEVLRAGKPLRLSRAEVLKQLGTLLSFRGIINIHAELLDDPDFVWSNKGMENCFVEVSRNLDIRRRIATFNKKLDYANELAAFLSDHLNQRHGTKLEWIIIWLIAVEVVSEVIHYAERLGWVNLDTFARKVEEELEDGVEPASNNGSGGVLVGWRKQGSGF